VILAALVVGEHPEVVPGDRGHHVPGRSDRVQTAEFVGFLGLAESCGTRSPCCAMPVRGPVWIGPTPRVLAALIRLLPGRLRAHRLVTPLAPSCARSRPPPGQARTHPRPSRADTTPARRTRHEQDPPRHYRPHSKTQAKPNKLISQKDQDDQAQMHGRAGFALLPTQHPPRRRALRTVTAKTAIEPLT
jgi:hypothetical protein